MQIDPLGISWYPSLLQKRVVVRRLCVIFGFTLSWAIRVSAVAPSSDPTVIAGPPLNRSEGAVPVPQGSVMETEPASLLDDYAVSRWQMEDGLPADSIFALTFSADGYLWCLTDKALVRFDGLRFEAVDWRPKSTGSSGWFGMDEMSGESLWIYGSAGVFRFGPHVMGMPLCKETPIPAATTVRRVMRGPDGILWVAGVQGLYRVEGSQTRFHGLPKPTQGPSPEIKAVEMAVDGQIWIAAGPAILRFASGRYEAESALNGAVEHLSIGRDGTVWAATSTNLYGRVGGRWHSISAPSHRNHPRWRITALLAIDKGEVWVGTTSGLCRWREGEWTMLSPRDGFYPLEIQCLARDTEGHIWAGSSGGLLRLRRKVVQVFDSGLVLRRHSFTAVLPDPAVGLWVGVAGGGLLEGAPAAFHPSGQAPVSHSAVISALLKSRDGAIWIGTQGDYLWRCWSNRSECITEPFREASSAVNINALLEDRKGRIWAGTGAGVMVFNPGKRQLEAYPGLPAEARVNALVEDRTGSIWAGLQGEGVAKIQSDGRVVLFRRAQGLPADTVMSLCLDSNDVLWAGTSAGLGRWDGSKWASVTDRQGLPEGSIMQLLEDGPHLWVGTRYGIARLSRAEIEEVVAGRKAVLTPLPLGRDEGMRAEQCNSGFGNLAARDAGGRLWFSTQDGLVGIDPKRVTSKGSLGCRAYIEEIRVGRAVVNSLVSGLSHESLSFSIPPDGERLSIRYSAPFFSAPDQVQFKRMLEGYDLVWSPAMTSRTIVYPRLPPGNYRFRVMAGVGGAWRESTQTVDFVVNPAFWQQYWFWILTSSLALALVGLFVRAAEKQRSRRRFIELEREQSLDRERSRIAHDLHDDLGAALTEIGLLGAVAQRPAVTPDRAQHYLGEITEKVRMMVDTLDEIVWAINPRNDTVTSLGDYFCEYAQRILHLASIRCRLDLAPTLPIHPLDPNRRHNLFLAFNEALNNGIRHSGATEVLIRITGECGCLVVSVEDNGCGLSKGALLEGAEGLKSMRRRLERMGGRCEIEGRDGQGTTVRFIVPLE